MNEVSRLGPNRHLIGQIHHRSHRGRLGGVDKLEAKYYDEELA
jgi:hypothetical protein